MVIFGVVLIVLGVAFVVLGFAGAVLEMFRPPKGELAPSLPNITDLIKAATALLKELAAAPIWLACVFIGSVFLAAGGYLIAQ